jgi:hypothetical protein
MGETIDALSAGAALFQHVQRAFLEKRVGSVLAAILLTRGGGDTAEADAILQKATDDATTALVAVLSFPGVSYTASPEVEFLHELLAANGGYSDARPIGGGRYACIVRFMYTVGIITGKIGDKTGFEGRWCYHNHRSAKQALDAWDGQGEPTGWHRQPGTGRRVSTSADEVDEDGNVVGAVGVIYRRL